MLPPRRRTSAPTGRSAEPSGRHKPARPVGSRGVQAELVANLLKLGATPADVGQGDVPWVCLADSEGNEFCVLTPG